MAEKRKFKLSKRHVIAGVGLVAAILIALGLGALVRWLQAEYDKDNPSQSQNESREPRAGTEIQDLQSEGKTEEANEKIQEILNDPNSSNDIKYITYIQQGNGYVNIGNVQAGVDAYLKAYEISQTYEVTLLLGDSYAQLGDKPKAVEFYKKALALIPDSPIVEDEKAAIEQKIVAQGGQV